MTILSIAQNTLAEIRGQEQITQLVGSSNETAVRALALIKREVQELSRRHRWQVLTKEHEITTADGTAAYPLPSDYRWAIPSTWQDRTNDRRIIGPLSPTEWQRLKRDNFVGSMTKFFRIQGNEMLIYPTPTAVESLFFEYVSNAVYLDVDGTTTKADITADTDSVLLDEHLVGLGFAWRWLKSIGLPFAEAYDAYEKERKYTFTRDGGARVINMGASGNAAHSTRPHPADVVSTS